ncbi:hyalin-like, partial [Anneissia japonica]|uniref:hyalin-like n=1 Tax=Anneissia japonica TaxID=1529436 RepID=UPI0014259D8D
MFNCPADISQAGGVVHWTPPTATDNTAKVTLLSDKTPGSTFPIGVTSVEYTAMDQYNNVNYCVFSVTVEGDGSPVVESCPPTIQLEAPEGSTTVNATWTTPTATDDEGVTSITSSHSSGDEFHIGSTTVLYVFEDSSGNSASCSFSVVVTEPTDNTSPSVTCPDNIYGTAIAGTTAMLVTWEEPVATDNVGIQVLSPTHNPSSAFPVGETVVTYVAIDTSGNSDQCTFTVTVEEFIDSNAPTINGCPNDISVETSSANIPLPITWIEPTAADNSGDVVLNSTHSPGTSFDLGSTTVTYTATDTSENTDICTFHIEVT